MLTPFVKELAGESRSSGRLEEQAGEQHTEDTMDWEQEEDMRKCEELVTLLLKK